MQIFLPRFSFPTSSEKISYGSKVAHAPVPELWGTRVGDLDGCLFGECLFGECRFGISNGSRGWASQKSPKENQGQEDGPLSQILHRTKLLAPSIPIPPPRGVGQKSLKRELRDEGFFSSARSLLITLEDGNRA